MNLQHRVTSLFYNFPKRNKTLFPRTETQALHFTGNTTMIVTKTTQFTCRRTRRPVTTTALMRIMAMTRRGVMIRLLLMKVNIRDQKILQLNMRLLISDGRQLADRDSMIVLTKWKSGGRNIFVRVPQISKQALYGRRSQFLWFMTSYTSPYMAQKEKLPRNPMVMPPKDISSRPEYL